MMRKTALLLLLMLLPGLAFAWNPGHGPFCLYNCVVPVASIAASPSPVVLPSTGDGTVNVTWTWNESQAAPMLEYMCLAWTTSSDPDYHILDCEHPGNTYYVTYNKIGNQCIVFGVCEFAVVAWNPLIPNNNPSPSKSSTFRAGSLFSVTAVLSGSGSGTGGGTGGGGTGGGTGGGGGGIQPCAIRAKGKLSTQMLPPPTSCR